MTTVTLGPVLLAYDGSDLARLAIEEASRQLRPGREALVLTVWRTFAVGFVPVRELTIDAAATNVVKAAAEETAAQGVSLAEAAGFRARGVTINAAPTWKGITDVAKEHDASLIVLGSHGREGLSGFVVGSVAGSVAAHSHRTVLIVHRRA